MVDYIKNMTNRAGWIKTIIVGGVGGGVAGSVAAIADPSKYSFPKDLGTGKMWPFFISGAAMTIGAMLLKSPFGSKVTAQVRESKAALEESKQTIAQAKSNLTATKSPEKPLPPKEK